MLRKYSSSRTHSDNLKLGSLSAFAAGMVNIGSLLLFFSFSSNITGHYAILASEIVKGNYYQIGVVLTWLFLFFLGSFVANLSVIHLSPKNRYWAHALPLLLEIICLLSVGLYGEFLYKETLIETEVLLSIMLFAMGLQNGLTASISNFSVKTTHLTGTTTDLGILFSLFTKKEYRNQKILQEKAVLLLTITSSYMLGALSSGLAYTVLGFRIFHLVSLVLIAIIAYDGSKLYVKQFWRKRNLKNGVPPRNSLITLETKKERSIAS
ncbi:YoaK family protein [Flavobacterium stagni]|uniref:DUF1275 domain-containing protein n=1 Tax=Flavobacterium stagni TaxID=2506421 RepID=A0A4V1N2Z8_9FLAO|nr:YoaK family protein [Flavobacterium stagni]RXR24250.1 DUF1275 domain-containing protein [Flavobacterium stagni]